nr:putative ribonuclease H-like domain-containing protein [Tanacetum cinerariifolium]
MNQNYFEPNPCYDSKSFGFDQIQPPQQFVNIQPQEIPEVIPFIESKEWIETKNELYKMMEAYTERMNQQRKELYRVHDNIEDLIGKNFKIIHKKSSISLNNTSQISLVIAITPDLPTKEPEYSLNMGDEHLSTIQETKSDEVIKYSVKNLVPIPSEFEVTSDNEKIADMILESLSPSPIPVEDSDSHMEEIDLFLATDDLMPPGIENNDYDSEGDIHFLKELLSNDTLPLPENKSSNLDHLDVLSFPRPPLESPDVEVFFDFGPDTSVLTTKVVKGISEHYVLIPNILPTLPTLDPNLDFTPFHDSLGSGNKIFDPAILIEVQYERILSRKEFYISFIRDPLYPFCKLKGIKREFSVPRTPQQNGIAERKNRTLIDATRTMLADSLLPIPFWAEAVNTACYVQNRKKGDAAFDGKEHDAEKPESAVNLSPSRNRDLYADSEDYSKDSSNNVSAAGPIVPTTGQNYSNSTNPISAGEREDITYFDHENVGAEADFNNLETSIIVSPIPTTRTNKDHLVAQIIGDMSSTTQTRSMTRVIRDQGGLSHIFNEEFHTFMAIGTKWVYRNKKDERCIIVRNKARLVTQEHTQEEGIDYEEVFALVPRIEAIRLFLAYASFMGFIVYQMDVKSAFLYGTIKEEVYVCQPSGFEDLDYPNKVVKALYGLHQAPRAWYETLANYLLDNGFYRGQINQTLFIKKQKGDILLVYIYVDDIIFGATNKALCKSFEKLMKDKFQMSFIGELTFFLGLQSLLDLAASFFSAALFDSSNQQHQLLPDSTNILTGSKDGPIDYPADEGDYDDDESSEDDADDEDEEEASDEEEEHLAPVDSAVVVSLVVDIVPFFEETKPFETDEFAATPPPLAYRTTARMSIRAQAHIPFPSEVEVDRLLAIPTPPPSPLTPLSSPLPYIPSPPFPLRDASPLPSPPLPPPSSPLLPPVDRKDDIPEADIPPQKRLCLTAHIPRVTYTSISSDYEEPYDAGSLGVIIYGYDGLPMHPVDTPSSDYVSGPEEPEQASLSPDYMPGAEYPEYLAPSDDEIPIED